MTSPTMPITVCVISCVLARHVGMCVRACARASVGVQVIAHTRLFAFVELRESACGFTHHCVCVHVCLCLRGLVYFCVWVQNGEGGRREEGVCVCVCEEKELRTYKSTYTHMSIHTEGV
jgi:hypothetical protein